MTRSASFRAACLQLNSGNDLDANLAAVHALAREAVRGGNALRVFGL